MIVAITGGSGFIGKKLADKHLSMGDSVRVLTRNRVQKEKNTEFYIGDLTDENVYLDDFLNSVDVLYNCAGELDNESVMYDLHVNGTSKIIKASNGNVKRWVQLSSVGAYGKKNRGPINELSLESPQGQYEITKTISDDLVRKSGIPYVILRPSVVFSNSMKNQSLFSMVNHIDSGLFIYIGKGAIVNYVHVDDVVRSLILCSMHALSINNTYIVSQSITLVDMVNSILEGCGSSKTRFFRFPETLVRLLASVINIFIQSPLTISRINALTNLCYYDSEKIKDNLGFAYSTSLQDRFVQFSSKVKHND